MTTFRLSAEAFAAAQDEFGEVVKVVRDGAYPLRVILSEKPVQTLENDGQTVVDSVQLFADFSMQDLRDAGINSIEHGDLIDRDGERFTVVSVMDRMGYQRARLHVDRPLSRARAW